MVLVPEGLLKHHSGLLIGTKLKLSYLFHSGVCPGHVAKKKSIFSWLFRNCEQFWATIWNSDDIAGQISVGLKPRDCADCVYRPALPLSRPGTQPGEYTFGLWAGDGRARIFLHQSLNRVARVRPKLKVLKKTQQKKQKPKAVRPFFSA